MGVIRRQAISNSIISYVGILLGYLNVAILFPRLLGDELFGFTQVVIAAMMLFSTFGSLGLRNVTLRYFPIFKTQFKESPNPFVSVLALTSLIGSLISILMLLLFEKEVVDFYSERAPLIANYVHLLYFLIPVGIFGISLDSYSQALHNTAATAFFKEVIVRILNLMVVLLFFYGMVSEPRFVWLFASIQGIYGLMMLTYLHVNEPFRFAKNLSALNRSQLIDMGKYAGVSLFSSTIGMSANIQMILVGTIVGLRSAAIFGVASAIGKVLNVTGKSVNRIGSAVVSDAWAQNDLAKINRIYAKSARTNLIFAGLVFTVIMVNLDSLFVLLPTGYRSGEKVLILLMLAKVVNLATGMNAGIIQQSKRYRMNLFFNLLTLVLTVGLNVWLIPIMDITGVGVADLTTVSIVNVLRFWYLKRTFNMQPFDSATFYHLVLIAALSILGYYWHPILDWWIDIPIRAALFGAVYVLIIFRLKWSADFNESIELAYQKFQAMISRN